MTRGNQREIDRQRAQNRHAYKADEKKKSGNFLARREADAAALTEKIAKKREAEETIARGETIPDPEKRIHGAVKKKDGSKPK
jgi:hypothetical protein